MLHSAQGQGDAGALGLQGICACIVRKSLFDSTVRARRVARDHERRHVVGPQRQARLGMTARLCRVAFLQAQHGQQLSHRRMARVRGVGLFAQHPGAVRPAGIEMTDRQGQQLFERDSGQCHAPS